MVKGTSPRWLPKSIQTGSEQQGWGFLWLLCVRAVHCIFALCTGWDCLASYCYHPYATFEIKIQLAIIKEFYLSKSTDLIWNTGHLHIHSQNVGIGKLFGSFYVNRKDSCDLLLLVEHVWTFAVNVNFLVAEAWLTEI